jgi:imidazoleglycerol phosphate synthase glutamine amidotransferase subunit HisH
MTSLEKSGYADALREWIHTDKPFLEICIGLQLLFDSAEEALPYRGKAYPGPGYNSRRCKALPRP